MRLDKQNTECTTDLFIIYKKKQIKKSQMRIDSMDRVTLHQAVCRATTWAVGAVAAGRPK